MNHRIKILGFLVVSFFAILLMVTSFTQKNHIAYKGKEMLSMVKSTAYTIDSAQLNKLSSYLVIDLREREQTLLDPVMGAINIPVSELLTEENQAIFKRADAKVFVAYEPMIAHEAWMLMSQLGYNNMYVMGLPTPPNQFELPRDNMGPKQPLGNDH